MITLNPSPRKMFGRPARRKKGTPVVHTTKPIAVTKMTSFQSGVSSTSSGMSSSLHVEGDRKAKAAADALVRDIEALGYNLDCESFITRGTNTSEMPKKERYATPKGKHKKIISDGINEEESSSSDDSSDSSSDGSGESSSDDEESDDSSSSSSTSSDDSGNCEIPNKKQETKKKNSEHVDKTTENDLRRRKKKKQIEVAGDAAVAPTTSSLVSSPRPKVVEINQIPGVTDRISSQENTSKHMPRVGSKASVSTFTTNTPTAASGVPNGSQQQKTTFWPNSSTYDEPSAPQLPPPATITIGPGPSQEQLLHSSKGFKTNARVSSPVSVQKSQQKGGYEISLTDDSEQNRRGASFQPKRNSQHKHADKEELDRSSELHTDDNHANNSRNVGTDDEDTKRSSSKENSSSRHFGANRPKDQPTSRSRSPSPQRGRQGNRRSHREHQKHDQSSGNSKTTKNITSESDRLTEREDKNHGQAKSSHHHGSLGTESRKVGTTNSGVKASYNKTENGDREHRHVDEITTPARTETAHRQGDSENEYRSHDFSTKSNSAKNQDTSEQDLRKADFTNTKLHTPERQYTSHSPSKEIAEAIGGIHRNSAISPVLDMEESLVTGPRAPMLYPSQYAHDNVRYNTTNNGNADIDQLHAPSQYSGESLSTAVSTEEVGHIVIDGMSVLNQPKVSNKTVHPKVQVQKTCWGPQRRRQHKRNGYHTRSKHRRGSHLTDERVLTKKRSVLGNLFRKRGGTVNHHNEPPAAATSAPNSPVSAIRPVAPVRVIENGNEEGFDLELVTDKNVSGISPKNWFRRRRKGESDNLEAELVSARNAGRGFGFDENQLKILNSHMLRTNDFTDHEKEKMLEIAANTSENLMNMERTGGKPAGEDGTKDEEDRGLPLPTTAGSGADPTSPRGSSIKSVPPAVQRAFGELYAALVGSVPASQVPANNNSNHETIEETTTALPPSEKSSGRGHVQSISTEDEGACDNDEHQHGTGATESQHNTNPTTHHAEGSQSQGVNHRSSSKEGYGKPIGRKTYGGKDEESRQTDKHNASRTGTKSTSSELSMSKDSSKHPKPGQLAGRKTYGGKDEESRQTDKHNASRTGTKSTSSELSMSKGSSKHPKPGQLATPTMLVKPLSTTKMMVAQKEHDFAFAPDAVGGSYYGEATEGTTEMTNKELREPTSDNLPRSGGEGSIEEVVSPRIGWKFWTIGRRNRRNKSPTKLRSGDGDPSNNDPSHLSEMVIEIRKEKNKSNRNGSGFHLPKRSRSTSRLPRRGKNPTRNIEPEYINTAPFDRRSPVGFDSSPSSKIAARSPRKMSPRKVSPNVLSPTEMGSRSTTRARSPNRMSRRNKDHPNVEAVKSFAADWAKLNDATKVLEQVMNSMDENQSTGTLDEAEMLLATGESNMVDVEKALLTLKTHAKKLGVRETDLLIATAKSYDSGAFSDISFAMGEEFMDALNSYLRYKK